MQGVVYVALAGEDGVGRGEIVRQFLVPATVLVVEEAVGDGAPDAAIAVFVELVGWQVLVEEMRGTGGLAHRPPQLFRLGGRVVPVQRVKEASLFPVPAKGHGLDEQRFCRHRHPFVLAVSQHPELEDEACPFQPVAGGGAGRAEHFVAAIILVQHPVVVEMLRNAEVQSTCGTADDEVGDALGFRQIGLVAGHFEGCHQRFCQVHVRVLAAILLDGRPVAVEFFRDGAVPFFPKLGVQNLGNIRQHLVGQRMPNGLCGGSRKQHEGVTITLLGGIDRAVLIHLPEISAMLGVAVIVPQIGHAMVDDIAAAGATEQMADGEAMHHAGRHMNAAHRIVRLKWHALPVKIEKAAFWIDGAVLEEVEQTFSLLCQPLPVPGQGAPVCFRVVGLGHAFLRMIGFMRFSISLGRNGVIHNGNFVALR